MRPQEEGGRASDRWGVFSLTTLVIQALVVQKNKTAFLAACVVQVNQTHKPFHSIAPALGTQTNASWAGNPAGPPQTRAS